MIRRDTRDQDGQPCWLLISQIEHAKLAGQLAEAWGASPFAALPSKDELLPALYHHDDGWSLWEKNPTLDAQKGIPLDFMEIPLEDSLAIWERSIRGIVGTGYLAAYVVSGHFSALLRRSLSARGPGNELPSPAVRFIAQQLGLRNQWLNSWLGGGGGRTPELADRALAYLQMFDAMSLWFCCAPRREPREFVVPDGQRVTLRPVSASTVEFDPWPYETKSLTVAVRRCRVPAARYQNAQTLAAAASSPSELGWRLAGKGRQGGEV